MNKKVSIITVCYNEEVDILKTCESVVNQTSCDYEWIIVDGGSTDDTLVIIEKYRQNVTRLISEPDNGIYDAMNKGIAMAQGEWLIFMNSGDCFYDTGVIERVFGDSEYPSGILYGDCVSEQRNGSLLDWLQPKSINMDFLLGFTGINHQSTFIKKYLFTKYGYYDTSFRSASDSEKWCCFYQHGVAFEKLPYKIARVKGYNGMSSRPENAYLIKKEQQRIREKYVSSKLSTSIIKRTLIQRIKLFFDKHK
jgi:glycosyltransferase involved in cell wall biosynthesis